MKRAAPALLALAVAGTLVCASACNAVLGIPEVQRRGEDGGGADADDGGDGDQGPDAAALDADPPGDAAGSDARAACNAGQKACGTSCVSLVDPATGCGAATCAPCAFAHASSVCVSGACAIDKCELGYADCNNSRTDGCEVDTRVDPAHCGKCTGACPANWTCTSSACMCATDPSCGTLGTCNTTTGVCSCDGELCSAGSTCDQQGFCAF